jgi:hypothetical protein
MGIHVINTLLLTNEERQPFQSMIVCRTGSDNDEKIMLYTMYFYTYRDYLWIESTF